MTLAVAVLLISALSTTGLLALCAANSRRHWFVRTTAFLAVLAPLLLVPAYEPFIALSLQGAVVAGGLWVGRALSRKRLAAVSKVEADSQSRRWRFSLSSLLMTMVLCGIGAAVASRAPALNRYAWQSVLLIGVCGGLATLLGWRAANGRGWRRWAGLIAAVVASAGIAAAPACFDWFLLSFEEFADWPPDPTSPVAALYALPDRPLLTWFGIVPVVALCVFLGIWSATIVVSVAFARHSSLLGKWLAWAAPMAVLMLVGLPAASAMFCLLTREPIPDESLPSPNGYEDFLAAGKILASPGQWQSYPGLGAPPTEAELQKAVDGAQVALARGRIGLQRDVVARVDYLDGELESMDQLQSLSAFGRMLASEGQLHEMHEQPLRAMQSYLDCIEFGIRSIRGGMMIDGLMGFVSALNGANAVFKLRGEFDAETCRTGARRILAALDHLESKELLLYRDRVWSQHARGWHGCLLLGLTDLTNDHFMDMGPEAYLYAHERNVAALRMVALELLAQARFLESGTWPRSAEELRSQAKLPASALADPFDPAGGLLRLTSTGDGILFYSVGENGVDDGGISPNVENEDGVMEGGDLRLAEVFKLMESESEESNADESEAAAEDAVSVGEVETPLEE